MNGLSIKAGAAIGHNPMGSEWQIIGSSSGNAYTKFSWEKSIANINPKVITALDNLNGIPQITDPGGYYPGQCVSFIKTYTQNLGITMGVFMGPKNDPYREGAKWGFHNPPLPVGRYDKINFTGNEKPKVGDIIFFDGTLANGYGHVAVIQSVLGDGRVIIQESNANNAALETWDSNGDGIIGTKVTRQTINLNAVPKGYGRVLGWLNLKV